MDWNHLPVAGGYWDQDPELLDSWRIIRQVKSKVEYEKKRKEEVNKRGRRRPAGL